MRYVPLKVHISICFLTRDAVHAYVTNKLDYCKSVIYCLPNYFITKLQYVHNLADRLLTSTHKFDHITPALMQLHQFQFKFRIDFKIILLTYKDLHKKAPEHICNLIMCMKVHAPSGLLFMTIYYWWNPKPDLCHMVIEHFAKLLLNSGIGYQGISDKANLSIVLNAHSRYIFSKLLLICNYIMTHYICYVLQDTST